MSAFPFFSLQYVFQKSVHFQHHLSGWFMKLPQHNNDNYYNVMWGESLEKHLNT